MTEIKTPKQRRVLVWRCMVQKEYFCTLTTSRMFRIVHMYNSSSRSSVDVLHAMYNIAECIDEYCNAPSPDITLPVANQLCNLVNYLGHSPVTLEDVSSHVCTPPIGFTYHYLWDSPALALFKVVISTSCNKMCIGIYYESTGFRAEVH